MSSCLKILRIMQKISIDRKIKIGYLFECCMKRNGNGVIALSANRLKDAIDISKLTIGDALLLKHIFGLSNSEATAIFLGGNKRGNI